MSRTLQDFAADLRREGGVGLKTKLQRLSAAMAITGERYAKANYGVNGLGVVTGRLKQSIIGRSLAAEEGFGLVLTAGDRNRVIYAAVHEFGYPIRNIPARPYLKPAIDHVREKLPNDIRRLVASSILERPWSP
jgi:phage gpG-like protein